MNDYTDGGKRRPKNPDSFGTPVSYMKERGFFQPLPSTTNPLGLCHFYHTDPASISMLAPPKSPATLEHLSGLLLLAKTQHQPYIIVVFQGGPITPWGYCRSCIHGAHLLVFQSFGLMRPRTGTSHACPVAHSVCIPSRMIQRT